VRDSVLQRDSVLHVSDVLASSTHENLLSEFGSALCYAGIQEPLLGVAQIVDHNRAGNAENSVRFMREPVSAEFGSRAWHAQVVGSAIGKLVPFLAVAACVKSATAKLPSEALLAKHGSIGLSLREAACTGFIADALFKPTATQDDWIFQRTRNGTIGAITFSVMTAGSLGLDALAKAKFASKIGAGGVLTNSVFSGIVSGLPAGLVTAELESLKTHGRLSTRQELAQSIYSTAIVGGVLGPVNYYGAKVGESLLGNRKISSESLQHREPSNSGVPQPGELLPIGSRRPEAVANDNVASRSEVIGLPEVLQRLTNDAQWSQLRADQQRVVTSAVERLFTQLHESGVDSASFFGRGFDAQMFVRARNHLNRHAAEGDGLSAAALDHHSAALVTTFGKDWKIWLDQMELSGVPRTDAAACLPLRAPEKQAGLAQLLMEHTTPARTKESNLDHSDVVSLVTAIGNHWQKMRPEHRTLSMDELAFRLTEGMSRSEFLAQRDSLSKIRLANSTPDAAGLAASGELIATTSNTANAASLCFRTEGSRTHIPLLGVEAAYRRLGLAKLLFRELEAHIPKGNTITLDVAANNSAAVNLYFGLGFVRDSRLAGNSSVLSLSKGGDSR
jgi:ribosomal protein S18 acetylase RimI-like enzyme